jgi:hypothetical protein
MPIIRSSRVLYKWLLPVVFSAVKMEIVIFIFFRLAAVVFSALIFTALNTTGSNQLYNNLELLMMGIMVPPKHVEQTLRSAIKIYLLLLVGILFPHSLELVLKYPVFSWKISTNFDI